jgi:large subunit ribosomal protein L5
VPARLKERYEREVKPELISRYRYKSPMQAPRVEKITLNMGVGDAKLNTSLLDAASEQLGTIAGQKPAIRRARKSIANFKLREGMPVGVKVTLRRDRMYEMLDRLQSIAIPRIRDFRGLNPRAFDGRGNYSMGIREQIIFPEVDYDAIDQVRGLDISITTTASTDDEARALLRLLGMPFRGDDGNSPASAPQAPAESPAAADEAPASEAEPEAASEEPQATDQAPAAGDGPAEPPAEAASQEQPADAGETPAAAADAPSDAGADASGAEVGDEAEEAADAKAEADEQAGESVDSGDAEADVETDKQTDEEIQEEAG